MARRVKKEVYQRQTIVFYEEEKDIYDGILELAERNKQSLRGAIMLAIERYVQDSFKEEEGTNRESSSELYHLDQIGMILKQLQEQAKPDLTVTTPPVVETKVEEPQPEIKETAEEKKPADPDREFAPVIDPNLKSLFG